MEELENSYKIDFSDLEDRLNECQDSHQSFINKKAYEILTL